MSAYQVISSWGSWTLRDGILKNQMNSNAELSCRGGGQEVVRDRAMVVKYITNFSCLNIMKSDLIKKLRMCMINIFKLLQEN